MEIKNFFRPYSISLKNTKRFSLEFIQRFAVGLFIVSGLQFWPSIASASILWVQPVHDTLQEPTQATEYSMQYGITGVSGTILSVLYYGNYGSCPAGNAPIVRVNVYDSGGSSYSSGTLNADGSCTYTGGSVSVISSDSLLSSSASFLRYSNCSYLIIFSMLLFSINI